MNLAILQPVTGPEAAQPYRDEVAALGAALLDRGHRVSLTVLASCDETALARLADDRPDLILLYVESLAADLAFRIAGALTMVRGVPLIAFGPHARLQPDACLSMPGAEAVAVGPADFTIPDYVAARQHSLDHLRAPGLWVKLETGVMRNPPARPPRSLDGLPAPARHLYPSDRIIDPTGFVRVDAARGGDGVPLAAAGDAPADWSAAAWPVLHRPVDSVLQEMQQLAEVYWDLAGFRIGNERWASRLEWLAEFTPRYAREVALPLRTTLRAADVTADTAALLARTGCKEVRLPVGSGSALIRSDILGMDLSPETAEAAFAALRKAGIRSVALVELGAPYETPDSLRQTVDFLRRVDPDLVEAGLHFPAPGTPSYKVAKENGWLVPDPAAAHLAGQPSVALPRLTADDLLLARESLPYAVHRPRIVPLIRTARRVRIGKWGTLYDLVVKPFLGPPLRRSTKNR